MKMRQILIRHRRAAALLLAAAALGFLLLGAYLLRVAAYQRAVKNLTFSSLDIAAVPDGDYTGECDVGLVGAKVLVRVRGGRIAHIGLLAHKNGRGKAAEGILEEMVAQQKIDVEAVAGATNSSQVIKKAVENALKMAIDK